MEIQKERFVNIKKYNLEAKWKVGNEKGNNSETNAPFNYSGLWIMHTGQDANNIFDLILHWASVYLKTGKSEKKWFHCSICCFGLRLRGSKACI